MNILVVPMVSHHGNVNKSMTGGYLYKRMPWKKSTSIIVKNQSDERHVFEPPQVGDERGKDP